MTDEGDETDGETKEDLRRELAEARSTIRKLEGELTETNEGMLALTLELENAKQRYQTIFEESNDAILLIDPDEDSIHEANPRACELLGYSLNRLTALSPSDIFPSVRKKSSTFAEAVVDGWADGFTCRTKDGRDLEVYVSASMVTLDNRTLLLASMRDITQRKRREQRLQVLNRIFRHNLRNDGNLIQGHADLLHAALSDSEYESSISVISETIDKILNLSGKVRRIQDVLDRGRVQTCPLSELLETQREQFEQTHSRATLSVSPPASDAMVGQRLGAALHEAIENAINHNSPETTVEIVAAIDDAETLSLEVKDDGSGIPDHEQQTLQTGSETSLTHGNGIGLWFIKWVVDSLGGELTISSADSTGTVLSMVVPLETDHTSDQLTQTSLQRNS